MFKCTGCGKEFISSQGLGSHQRFGCSLAVKEAEGVMRSVQGLGLDLDLARSRPRPETATIPDLARSRPRPRPGQDLGQDLAHLLYSKEDLAEFNRFLGIRPQDVAQLKQETELAEAKAKLTKRKQYAERKPWRQLAVGLVIVGALLWFWAGGRFKIPFFGDATD